MNYLEKIPREPFLATDKKMPQLALFKIKGARPSKINKKPEPKNKIYATNWRHLNEKRKSRQTEFRACTQCCKPPTREPCGSEKAQRIFSTNTLK